MEADKKYKNCLYCKHFYYVDDRLDGICTYPANYGYIICNAITEGCRYFDEKEIYNDRLQKAWYLDT